MIRFRNDRLPLSLIVAIGLFGATLLVFWHVQDHQFLIWDDREYIVENPHLRSGLNLESIRWALTTTYASYWHPLAWVSHLVDYQLYGLNPKGHHFNSLLFHAASAVLLFFVLRRMTNSLWRSALCAAFFALHPLRIESVAWATERKDVLGTLFWMISLFVYLHYVERPNIKRYLLALLALTLGLAAKPTLVTLPFVLLLLDYWPLGRFSSRRSGILAGLFKPKPIVARFNDSTLLHLILEKIPFLLLAAASGIVTILAADQIGAVPKADVFPLGDCMANALVSYVKYMGKLIWPAGLSFFYPHPLGSLPWWQVFGAFQLLLCISLLVIWQRRLHPYLFVGWFWYLITIFPVIGVIQVGAQGMADRFTYIPHIGLSIMAVWGLSNLLSGWRFRKLSFAALGCLSLVALSLCTRFQLQYWKDSVTLFERALTVTSKNYMVHHFLGIALAEQGRYDESRTHFSKALQINPSYFPARYNLGFYEASRGRYKEAIKHYREALRMRPHDATIHNNLGNIYARQGRWEAAVRSYTEALRIQPDYAAARNNLASVLMHQGKVEEAIYNYSEALRIDPDFDMARQHLDLARRKRPGSNKEKEVCADPRAPF